MQPAGAFDEDRRIAEAREPARDPDAAPVQHRLAKPHESHETAQADFAQPCVSVRRVVLCPGPEARVRGRGRGRRCPRARQRSALARPRAPHGRDRKAGSRRHDGESRLSRRRQQDPCPPIVRHSSATNMDYHGRTTDERAPTRIAGNPFIYAGLRAISGGGGIRTHETPHGALRFSRPHRLPPACRPFPSRSPLGSPAVRVGPKNSVAADQGPVRVFVPELPRPGPGLVDPPLARGRRDGRERSAAGVVESSVCGRGRCS
jgi:hypothetical protein